MVRENLAIESHRSRSRALHLFGYIKTGTVRYLGEVEYLGHHIEERPDKDGNPQNAFVFHLGFIGSNQKSSNDDGGSVNSLSSFLSKGMSISQLREAALQGVPNNSTLTQKTVNLFRRAEAVKRYALVRANGICEGCKSAAPFFTKDGPFLEVHHVFRLGDGGPDHPAAVIALCPNCHRRTHYAVDGISFNESLIGWLRRTEGTVD